MIKINGMVWAIQYVSPYFPLLENTYGNYTLACCDSYTRTIYISEDVSDKYLKKVLAHELTHAAMYSYNVYLTVEQEEVFADILASYGEEIINLTNLLFARLITKQNRGI